MGDEKLTVRQLAAREGVKESAVRYWLRLGLPHIRRGGIWIERKAFLEWWNSGRRACIGSVCKPI